MTKPIKPNLLELIKNKVEELRRNNPEFQLSDEEEELDTDIDSDDSTSCDSEDDEQ